MRSLIIVTMVIISLSFRMIHASILIFDPFSLHFDQIKEDLAKVTSETVVKTDTLEESIFSFTTCFLLLSPDANQYHSKTNEYDLSLKEQELLVEYLNRGNNIHIFSHPYYDGDSLMNPLYMHLNIKYAGSQLIMIAVDSAKGNSGTFTQDIDAFQIIRNIKDIPGIDFPDQPFIWADQKVSVLSGIKNLRSLDLCLLFPTPSGKIILDLFYFLDYLPYLESLSTFYNLESTSAKNPFLHKTNSEKDFYYTVFQSRDQITLSFPSSAKNFPTSLFLTGMQGKQYTFFSQAGENVFVIDKSRIASGVYILQLSDTDVQLSGSALTVTR